MPKFKITAPDGKAYVVTAPDGATQEQVLAYAQQHYQSQAPDAQARPAEWSKEGKAAFAREQQGAAHLFDKPGFVDLAKQGYQALGHHLANIPIGLGQLAAHDMAGLIDSGKPSSEHNLSGLIAGNGRQEHHPGVLGFLLDKRQAATDFVDQKVKAVDNAIAKRESDYQASVPDNPVTVTGAAAGEVLPWMAGAAGIRAAGVTPKASSLLGRLGLASVSGGTMGAAQPVTGGDYAAEKGAQVGIGALAAPIAEAVSAGGGRVLSALRNGNPVNPLDRAATDILRREADNPANLGIAAPSRVPGVNRTLAEQTLDPGVARLERNLRSTNKQFDALDRANNAARVGSLDSIAGSESDYANAKNIRDKVTGKIRDAAFSEGARRDASLAKQNSMRRAVAHGNTLDSTKGPLEAHIRAIAEANQGRPSVLGTMASVSKAVKDAGDSIGGLYNVRKYIGDLLSGKAGADNSAAQSATRELMSVRDAIDKELSQRAPSFSRYLRAYQDFSQPINRMDVGRDLMDRSSGGAVLDPVTGQQVLTPAQFSKKARDLDAVAAKATGFAKAKASDILSPADIASIKAIQDDLERQAFRATAGSGGNSQTFERQAVQDRIKRGAGREALKHVPVLGRFAGDFLDMLDKSRNERVKERLAYLVANPDEARRVLSSLPPAGQKVVHDALLGIGGPAGRIASEAGNSQPSQ